MNKRKVERKRAQEKKKERKERKKRNQTPKGNIRSAIPFGQLYIIDCK